MAWTPNNMTGNLHNNMDRKKKPTDRDYGGDCQVDGVVYYLDAWKSADGKKLTLNARKRDNNSHDLGDKGELTFQGQEHAAGTMTLNGKTWAMAGNVTVARTGKKYLLLTFAEQTTQLMTETTDSPF